MKRRAFFYRILGLLALVLVLLGQTSCATVPSAAPKEEKIPFGDFPPGAEVLFYGDIQRSRSLITELYRLGSVKTLQRVPQKSLEYAGQIYGALYKEGAQQRFYALVSGRFPVFQTNLSLIFNPDWKQKHSGGLSYWRSEKDGLSLIITSRKVTITDCKPELISSGTPDEPAHGNLTVLAEELSDSNFYLVFNSPESLVKKFMGGLGAIGSEFQIPLKQIILKVYPASEPSTYAMQARFDTASPSYGKALGALLTLASRFMQPKTQDMTQEGDPAQSDQILQQIGTLLLSERPAVAGPLVLLTSKTMTEAELALLLHRLLVYFDRTKIL
uniref:Lipoprotein n=1 Tax=Gracilinema caldarium TaxID=215591 RepID=A0A7C3E7V4_9SPIR